MARALGLAQKGSAAAAEAEGLREAQGTEHAHPATAAATPGRQGEGSFPGTGRRHGGQPRRGKAKARTPGEARAGAGAPAAAEVNSAAAVGDSILGSSPGTNSGEALSPGPTGSAGGEAGGTRGGATGSGLPPAPATPPVAPRRAADARTPAAASQSTHAASTRATGSQPGGVRGMDAGGGSWNEARAAASAVVVEGVPRILDASSGFVERSMDLSNIIAQR
eukprot:scaffold12017_cov120-Isochrysis_galbana.AAC.4